MPSQRGEQAEQDLRIARLFEEVFEAGHLGEHAVGLAGPFSGDGDHHRRELAIEPPHLASHLVSADAGHVDVHDDGVGRRGSDLADGLCSGVRLAHLVALVAQDFAERRDRVALVVADDEPQIAAQRR